MNNSDPVFKLENVYFNYPFGHTVLNNINLEIFRGEKVCILGANGTGKSTLLKLMAGLIYPVSGTFKAFGEEITEKVMSKDGYSKCYHRRVGFVFQNSDAQLFCSSVMEEIAFGPLQLSLDIEEVKRRVNDVIDMLEIEHLKDKTPFKLSGGEKKKVALACVLVLNPEVLILDEPTNGLDPRTQRWLSSLLIQLNRAGKTIITSTHNLELAQEISDRAVVFDEEHRIAADAEIRSILNDVELLKRVNLVDEYYHKHEGAGHAHFHIHNY